MTLHDKLATIVVRCVANFMIGRQNLHYKISSLQVLLTRNLLVRILAPRNEICGATDNNFFPFIMKRHGVEVDVVASNGDR